MLIGDDGQPRIVGVNLEVSNDSHSVQGSLRWQAPELLVPERFSNVDSGTTPQSDVYAFACVCLEVRICL